jgi:hypothetical protein
MTRRGNHHHPQLHPKCVLEHWLWQTIISKHQSMYVDGGKAGMGGFVFFAVFEGFYVFNFIYVEKLVKVFREDVSE